MELTKKGHPRSTVRPVVHNASVTTYSEHLVSVNLNAFINYLRTVYID